MRRDLHARRVSLALVGSGAWGYLPLESLGRFRLGHRPSLDGIRGIAVLLVLFGHFSVPGFSSGANVGVSIFFVLSGFLITALLLDEQADRGKVDLAAFYMRRARRLLPALAVYGTVIGITGAATLPALASVAAYVANWAWIAGLDMGAVAHAWSLSVEEQFYIAWPLLLGILVRRGWSQPATAIALLVCTALLFAFSDQYQRAFAGSDTRAQNILAGCIIAIAFHRWGERRMPTSAAAASAGLLVFLSATSFYGQLFAVTLPAAVLIAWAAVRPQLLSWPGLVAIGRISYGLYLWHYPFAYGHWPIFDELSPPVRLALQLTASFALAGASWVLVERRFLRRRQTHPASSLELRVGAGSTAIVPIRPVPDQRAG